MDPTRRFLLRAGSSLPAAAALSSLPAMAATRYAASMQIPATTVAPDVLARDENYWAAVASHFDITDEVNHLENGYWGAMGRETLASYQRHTAEVNRGNARYGRHAFPAQYMAVQRQVAGLLGVGADEIALTRGATEAMLALIGGYNRLRPGDQVLYADIDYDSMIGAMRWLQQRRGVQVERIALPVVPDHVQILQAYEAAFARLPRLKLVLLTQVSHRHGLVLPVAEIAERARVRGIDVIVDAAHGFGQIDYAVPQLKADFVGINLHKWIGAPVGVGAMYVRKGRVADLDPYMGETDDGRVGSRVHTGTVNFAAYRRCQKRSRCTSVSARPTSRRACATCASAGRCLRGRWRISKCCLRRIRRWPAPWPASACAGAPAWQTTWRCRSACWTSIACSPPIATGWTPAPACG